MRKFVFLLCALVSIAQLQAQIDYSKANSQSNAYMNQLDIAVDSGKFEKIRSILVAQDGVLLYEKYYNGAQQDTKHNARSVTKTIATLLTGIAIKQGYIGSEKDKIVDYLSYKKPFKNDDPRKAEITIEDLLTMSSIMECSDDNYFSRGNEERMYIIEDWTQFFVDLPIRSYPWEPKPEDQPYGRAFSYCSAGAAAVAEIVQSAIKRPVDTFAIQYLLNPLEIKDYNLHHNPEGTLNTAGGSEYQSRDFLKLIQLCLNNGTWNNEEIIPADWLAKASSPKAQARENVEYGYLFWINPFGKDKKYDAYYMSGNGGQKMVAIPELNATVVITTLNYGNRRAHGYSDEIMNDYVIPALTE